VVLLYKPESCLGDFTYRFLYNTPDSLRME
jgi:hypothetical protein